MLIIVRVRPALRFYASAYFLKKRLVKFTLSLRYVNTRMRIAVIEDSANYDQFRNVLVSFAKGCGGEMTTSDNAHKYDCAVIYGSYKKSRGRKAHRGKGRVIESGMPYVQLETQLVGRPISTAFHSEFRVGVNGFLWDDAKWGFEHITADRSKKVFERNGYNPECVWKADGDYVLLCMQKVGDASLRGLDIFQWTNNVAKELRAKTDRTIIVRPHPLYRKTTLHNKLKQEILSLPNVIWQDCDLTQKNFVPVQELFKDAWCTVTYTSGTGIDAVINGVPSVALDTGSMVYDVSSNSLDEINNPYRGDKKQWTNKIAHCQWSVAEFESGECWEHVRKSIR